MEIFRSRLAIPVAVSLFCAPTRAQVTERVSLAAGGVQATGDSFESAISADGRFVAFRSLAANLVPGDTNGWGDIFVRDRLSGTVERVSVDSGAVQANADSFESSISADGRFVAFRSLASNLVPGDTNGLSDIFVRDRQLGTTESVSVDSAAAEGDGPSFDPSISADGRYVAFASASTNLVAGDANARLDIFVRDRTGATTERASVDSGGLEGDEDSTDPSISGDGRTVSFASEATNLVVGDTNTISDVFVRDLQAATTVRASVDSVGTQGNDVSLDPSISADGNFVAFSSIATNLVAGDTNGAGDVFVRDLQGGATERASVATGGGQADSDSWTPAISGDGRYVAFATIATNLFPGDVNGWDDVVVRDRLATTTEPASVTTLGGMSLSESSTPSVSGDGRFVAFVSPATNLVPGDTNGAYDVFVRERGPGTVNLSISIGLGGAPGNGDSLDPSISADGRYVAFTSNATNLVLGDTNGFRDVFVRDRQLSTTVRVSVDSASTQANDHSEHPSISANGRYVAFESVATNLVAGDTNGVTDVFVHDLQSGATVRASVDTAGVQGNGNSTAPACSGSGDAVAFESDATNLVAGDTNGKTDAFVRGGLASLVSTTVRASVSSTGAQGNGDSTNPSISSSGALVAFDSASTNLVTGDTNAKVDVFVRNVTSGATTRWSVKADGSQANGDSTEPAMSGSGLLVAFQSDATDLVPGDSNLAVDTFVRENAAGRTGRVSVDSGGTQGLMGGSTRPSISFDGRHVGFTSDATNLVAGDTNGSSDIFSNDGLTGETVRSSVDSGGLQATGASGGSSISGDGRFLVFDSLASNLVLGDTNGFRDVFLRDEGVASSFHAYCFGDGTGAPCPCNNSGSPGHGCENSATTGGALLTVTGVASLTADTVQFTSSGEKPTALSIVLQGTQSIAPVVYGDGLRCTGGALKRLYAKSAVGGVVIAPVGADLSVSARSAFLNQPIPLGSTRTYMVYYRDVTPATFCPTPTGSNFNGTNGMLVAWGG